MAIRQELIKMHVKNAWKQSATNTLISKNTFIPLDKMDRYPVKYNC